MASSARVTVSPPVNGGALERAVVTWPVLAPIPASVPRRKVKPMEAIPHRPTNAMPVCADVSPQVLGLISESVTAFFGREVRIFSVKKLLPLNPLVNQWAGQGRVAVQNSHNLARRGR
jgi:hypothetical protein